MVLIRKITCTPIFLRATAAFHPFIYSMRNILPLSLSVGHISHLPAGGDVLTWNNILCFWRLGSPSNAVIKTTLSIITTSRCINIRTKDIFIPSGSIALLLPAGSNYRASSIFRPGTSVDKAEAEQWWLGLNCTLEVSLAIPRDVARKVWVSSGKFYFGSLVIVELTHHHSSGSFTLT